MFEWYVVAGIVGVRGLCNAALTLLVAELSGPSSRSSVGAAVLTVLSAGLTAAVLLGVLGLKASYLEFVVQALLLALVGSVVYANPSAGRSRAAIVVSLFATALLLFMIPVYGDALVAP